MAVNYYISLVKGQVNNPGLVVSGSSSTATADVELRMQTNNGTIPTKLTRQDVHNMVCTLLQFLDAQGNARGGGAPAYNGPTP